MNKNMIKKEKLVFMNVRIPVSAKKKIELYGEKNKMTLSDIIRDLIENFLIEIK